jgi:hypothetical protein
MWAWTERQEIRGGKGAAGVYSRLGDRRDRAWIIGEVLITGASMRIEAWSRTFRSRRSWRGASLPSSDCIQKRPAIRAIRALCGSVHYELL